MVIKRRFMGTPFDGILHQKAQRVDLSNTRGIIFNRPMRFIVNTPGGQIEIGAGDWVVYCPSGNRYVIKDADITALSQPSKKWWKVWG